MMRAEGIGWMGCVDRRSGEIVRVGVRVTAMDVPVRVLVVEEMLAFEQYRQERSSSLSELMNYMNAICKGTIA
jgi:hypothetical protein